MELGFTSREKRRGRLIRTVCAGEFLGDCVEDSFLISFSFPVVFSELGLRSSFFNMIFNMIIFYI